MTHFGGVVVSLLKEWEDGWWSLVGFKMFGAGDFFDSLTKGGISPGDPNLCGMHR